MKLTIDCPHCKKPNRVLPKEDTRPDLARRIGDTFTLSCRFCLKKHVVHVNDVKAETSKSILLFGWVLGILVTLILLFFYGAIALISFILPILVWQQDEKGVHGFNTYRINR